MAISSEMDGNERDHPSSQKVPAVLGTPATAAATSPFIATTSSRPPPIHIPSSQSSVQATEPPLSPHASVSVAAANAAVAASSRRPALKVVPPVSFDVGSRPDHENTNNGYFQNYIEGGTPSVPETKTVTSNGDHSGISKSREPSSEVHKRPIHSHTASASSASSIGSVATAPMEPVRRRMWFRKKSGGSATSLIVSSTELVDDVKIRILQKYPTSLQLKCDPADLAMTVPQSSKIRLELQPDENIIEVMDRFFPNGMKMTDAIEVGPSVSMWGPISSTSNMSSSSQNIRNGTPRANFQRARSYSNAPSHCEIPVLPQSAFPGTTHSTPGALTPGGPFGAASANTHLSYFNDQSGGIQGKPITPTQESGPPLVPLPEGFLPRSSPNEHQQQQHTNISTNSSAAASPSNLTPTNGSSSALSTPSTASASNYHSSAEGHNHRSSSSVLLLPRQLGPGKSSTGSNSSTSINEYKSTDSRTSPLGSNGTRNNIEKNKPENSASVAKIFGLNTYSTENSTANLMDNSIRPRSITQSFSTPSGSLLLKQGSIMDGMGPVVPVIKVLVVEDNKVNRQILEGVLRKAKVRYGMAFNGREALDKWKAGGYHIILMDIQLPVMTGLEVTKEIRRLEILNGIGAFPQAHKDGQAQLAAPAPHEIIKKSKGGFRSPVIIVALTASSDSDDKSEALAAGCNDFLTKPVNFIWLQKKLAEWGCMQALIDYDGWKKWSDEANDKDLTKSDGTASGKHSRRSSSHHAAQPSPADLSIDSKNIAVS